MSTKANRPVRGRAAAALAAHLGDALVAEDSTELTDMQAARDRGFVIRLPGRGIVTLGGELVFFGSSLIAAVFAESANLRAIELVPITCAEIDALADTLGIGWFELRFEKLPFPAVHP